MKNLFRVVLLTCLVAFPISAQAVLLQSAKVVPQGVGSIGGFGQLYFDPSEFMVYAQAAYGLGNNYQLEGRVAVGGLDTYVGGFIKNEVYTTSAFAFALWGGIHSQGNAFLDIAPILSHDFGPLEMYIGPYLALSLGDADTGMTLNPGLNFTTSPNLSVYIEMGLKVSKIPTSFVGGVRYYF